MPQTLTRTIAPPRRAIALKDRQIVAQVLSWDLYREVSPNEIESFLIVKDVLWVKLTGDRAVPIAVETFRSILAQQTQQQAQQELDEYLEKQSEEIAPEPIEIDCANGVYRVWKGSQLLGTYCRDSTGKWAAEPRYFGTKRRYKTATQAQAAITQPYAHR